MATLQKEPRGNKLYWRIAWIGADKQRQRIRLGEMPEGTARYIFTQIDQLIASKVAGQLLDSSIAKWLDRISDELRSKLAAAGLCESRKRATLTEFIDEYIAQRKGTAALNTIRNWQNSRRKLADYFGEDRQLHTITQGDADDWRQSLVNAELSAATISKAVKHAKQFTKAAIRKGFLQENPFDHLVAGGERNEERKEFVGREAIKAAIDACPDAEWRSIIALSRYGGLRCPSEVLALRWGDIDWNNGRVVVTSPKTKRHHKGYRTIPLFPELREILTEAQEIAPEGSVYVIRRYRDAGTNLRTQFERILKRAGVKPWGKLFHNMRASRQTELANEFPAHVVCDWMGNTEAVAKDHYLQTTGDHFAQAIASGGAQCGAQEPESALVGHSVGQKSPATNGSETQEIPGKTRKGQVYPALLQALKHPQGEWHSSEIVLSIAQSLEQVGHIVGQDALECLLRVIDTWPQLRPQDRQQLADSAELLLSDRNTTTPSYERSGR